jgi:hypothetical protein
MLGWNVDVSDIRKFIDSVVHNDTIAVDSPQEVEVMSGVE